jgi:hypothetical protein
MGGGQKKLSRRHPAPFSLWPCNFRRKKAVTGPISLQQAAPTLHFLISSKLVQIGIVGVHVWTFIAKLLCVKGHQLSNCCIDWCVCFQPVAWCHFDMRLALCLCSFSLGWPCCWCMLCSCISKVLGHIVRFPQCYALALLDTCNTTVYFCGIVVEYSDACTAIQSYILHNIVGIYRCRYVENDFAIDSAVYHGSFLMNTMLYNYTFRHFQCVFNIDTCPLFAPVLAVKE